MSGSGSYVVISPARDEEENIEKTIRSVVGQSIPPAAFIIVDDGSRDATGAIIDAYARRYAWMTALHRPDRGYRNSAGGEIDAFYFGYKQLPITDWKFIVKLDGDMSFESDYFARCLDYFDADPLLGMGSGVIYNLVNGALELERTPRFHVRGCAKMYRRACWEAIGGMYAFNGWDTLDEVKANMLGWKTRNFTSLKIIQHRPTGQAVGAWKNAVKNGAGSYISGYHPLYMLTKCLMRSWRKPFLIESAGLLYGFLKGYLTRTPRVEDRKLIGYLRKQQLNRLFFRPSIWK